MFGLSDLFFFAVAALVIAGLIRPRLFLPAQHATRSTIIHALGPWLLVIPVFSISPILGLAAILISIGLTASAISSLRSTVGNATPSYPDAPVPPAIPPLVNPRPAAFPQAQPAPARMAIPPNPDPPRRVPQPFKSERPATIQQGRWLPPGHESTIRIGRFEFAPEMVYFGSRLAAIKYAGTTEPSLLDPFLPVGTGDGSSAGFGYWPYYHELAPQARETYVRWLVDGRRDQSVDIGCVFLFFYGLERRLIHDRVLLQPGDERTRILLEVRRLRELYVQSASFQKYSGRLLDLASAADGHPADCDQTEPSPDMLKTSAELGPGLKQRLGGFAVKGMPIPPGWALAWVLAHPEIRLRTPAQRCPAEFQQLFRRQYILEHHDGLVIKPNKTQAALSYTPASASFGGSLALNLNTGLPDVTILTRPNRQLQEIADKCSNMLEPYSRWLGKHPDSRGSVAGTALLPRELLLESDNPEIDRLRSWAEARLGGASQAVLPVAELIELWWTDGIDSVDRKSALALASVFEAIGVGMEPDVRFGGPTPKHTNEAVLFRLRDGDASSPGVAYRGAVLLLELATMVAAADGSVAESEQTRIRQHLGQALEHTAGALTRLEAHAMWLRTQRPSLARVKKRVAELSAAQRDEIGEFLIGVAAADGRITPEEVEVLGRIYPILGLDPQDLYSHIHLFKTSPEESEAPAEPVTIRPRGAQGPGSPVPRPEINEGSAASGSMLLKLNQARIRAKVQETAAVAALLGSIFADEADPAPTVTRGATDRTRSPSALLTDDQDALLAYLGGKACWQREELEHFAGGRGMLLDGALEALNEAALEKCGQNLIEGDDPVEISIEVWKEFSQ